MLSSGKINKHGFHLLQAMKLAVEEINKNTGAQWLLPGVMLGYQMYDTCSVSAGILASLDVLDYWSSSASGTEPNSNNSQQHLAVIGPDSSSTSFTPATLLGAYLIPQVSKSSNMALDALHLIQQFFMHFCFILDLLRSLE